MAITEEQVKIIEVQAGHSIETIGQIRDHLKDLKKGLEDIDVTSEEYNAQLEKIALTQKTLSDAMKITRKEVEDAPGSYNALSKQMAALRKEWKSTGDAARRAELGQQINAINDHLKAFDASVGNYQRNVGNYSGAIIDAFGKLGGAASHAAEAAVGGFEMATQAVKAFQASNPIGGIILAVSFLIQNLDKLADLLDGKTAAALKEFEKNAKACADQIERIKTDADFDVKIAEAAGASTDAIFKMRLEAARATLQLAQMNKAQADALNVNMFNRKKVEKAREAANKQEQEAWDNLKKIFDEWTIEDVKRVNSSKEAKEAEAELFREYVDEDEAMLDEYHRMMEARRKEQAANDAQTAKQLAQTEEDNLKAWEAERSAKWAQLEEEKAISAERIKNKQKEAAVYIAATSSMFSAVADIIDKSSDEDEKNVRAVKALRTVSAIIDTYAAANAAYRSAVEIPGVGPIAGPAAAAAAIAAGLANVKAINSTNVSKTASPAAAISAPTLSVAAPAVVTQIESTRTLTGASQQTDLNTRVYVVYDDIAQAGKRVAATKNEASF